jgi:hypothetical protein
VALESTIYHSNFEGRQFLTFWDQNGILKVKGIIWCGLEFVGEKYGILHGNNRNLGLLIIWEEDVTMWEKLWCDRYCVLIRNYVISCFLLAVPCIASSSASIGVQLRSQIPPIHSLYSIQFLSID